MALKIKSKMVIESIEDENGTKIGEIRFNPDDSRIMQKLTKIVVDLENQLDRIKSLGEIPDIPTIDITDIRELEELSETFEKHAKGYDIELETTKSIIDDLSEVFGKETVELFTNGTMDIMSVMPLIEYVVPYVKESRNAKIEKYLPNKKEKTDVMS